MTAPPRAAEDPTVEPVPDEHPPTPTPKWAPWALLAICVLAAALYGWAIGANGYWGNTYYAAAVKSMSKSLPNFLFGSFDPAGVVTVDKPPLSLWPQVVATWIFGWHTWSVLLPQVVEGVAAVFLLHRTVRHWAGEHAALLAALLFALTPITVAINRDNNPDTMLNLCVVAAAYALTRSVAKSATARASTKWLWLSAFFVGCGFVAKMLEAWIVVPALAIGFLAGSRSRWGRRLLDLTGAGVVLAISSFWWNVLHDLWPGNKPYMGGSTDGTAWNLIFGYNGFGRILGEGFGRTTGAARGAGTPGAGAPGSGGPGGFGGPGGSGGHGGGAFGGQSGITRMFSESVGGQISWLIPLCLLLLVAVAVLGVRRYRQGLPARYDERAGWWLWGGWLLVAMVVFSFAQGIWHSYYTTLLAPAIAALAAAGIVLLWKEFRAGSAVGWLLPIGVLLTAGWAWVIVSRDVDWNGWLRWATVGVAVVAVAGLLVARASTGLRDGLGRGALALGVVAIVLTPAVWSGVKAFGSTTGGLTGNMPSAGPPGTEFGGRGGRGGLPSGRDGGAGMPSAQEIQQLMNRRGSAGLSAQQQAILNYAVRNSGSARITLAVNGGAMGAAGYVIGSDATVIGMGGFSGTDDAPTVDQLTQWARTGQLRFVLDGGRGDGQQGRGGDQPGRNGGTQGGRNDGQGSGSGGSGFGGGGRGGAASAARSAWIQQHCTVVPPSAYGGSTQQSGDTGGFGGFGDFGGTQTLYDCAARK